MSDPAREGFTCCGPMRAIYVHAALVADASTPPCAYLCERCGCWRHAYPAGDPRRAAVEQRMAVILAALFGELA